MRVLLVPHDMSDTEIEPETVRKAELILQEQQDGNFFCMKYRDGNPEDVKVKVLY